MPKKTDANQPEIVEALRGVGATVTSTHMVGKGFPDLVVGFRGKNYLIEVKDGNKVPSKQKLNDKEVEWHAAWNGQVDVAKYVEDALKIIGAI